MKTFTRSLVVALLLVGVVGAALPLTGCQTPQAEQKFDLDQAIAYTQLTLEIAQQGLTLYQLEMISAGKPVDAVKVELWKKRIQFLQDQLTELMAVRAAQQPAAAIK
jgi:hypothetical protein